MICNKCGAQCDGNQAFCLKCGSPIQLTADFNLIEKELASNIDELMNELESDGETLSEEADELKTVDVPLDEIKMDLKVLDINRGEMKADDDINEDDDITPVFIPNTRRETKGKTSGSVAKNKSSKSGKTKKIYGIIGGVVAVVAVAIIIIFAFGGDNDDNSATKSFGDYYASAESFYNSGEMDKALEDAYEALKIISSDADEIKIRKLIHNVYVQQNFSGAIYLENIERLMALGDTSEDYYAAVIDKYIEEGNTELLLSVMKNITEEQARKYFGENYVEAPKASKESGEFKNYVNVELTAAEGCSIYYCINADITDTAIEYNGEIAITEIGGQTVTAYAVSEKGIPSYTVQFVYNVVEGEAEGPVVSPASGIYTVPTQITINVPEGSKAYYTYTKDGEKPTVSSTEYKEPVDMLMDAEVFMAILVDEYGNVSEVTKIQYKYKPGRNETLSSGKDKVWAYYKNSGKINQDGNLADGSVLTVEYENAAVLENVEYYIYGAIATLTQEENSTITGITYVGVNTYDGTVVEGLIQAGDEFVLPEKE